MTKEEEKKLDKLIRTPLKDQYNDMRVLRELNKMWADGEWIRGEYRIFEVAGCYIGNFELRFIVDNKIDWDTLYAWYTYWLCTMGRNLGRRKPSLSI